MTDVNPWRIGPTSEDQYVDDRIKPLDDLVVLHKDHVHTTAGKAELCDVYDQRMERPVLVFIKRGITSISRELARQAVDSVSLVLYHNDFTNAALAKLQDKGIDTPPTFAFKDCGVVLAVVDESNRPNRPLLERMKIIAKIEFAFALTTLQSMLHGPVALYEIPKEPSDLAIWEDRAG